MYMTCKHLWEEFLAFERSKFGILGEKGLKPETFDRTDERSLERAPSEL